jgi:parallel beta-helix repeat protein
MVEAATYYVSNVGNDSNDGLSVNTSWASLAKVNNTTFQAGDSVLFRRGDTWRGHVAISNSGKVGAPLVFDAFGESNLPRPTVNGSELLTGWQRCSASTCGNLPNLDKIFFTKVNLPQLLYKKNPVDKGTYYNQGVSQLFINGAPAMYARHPNSGYLFNEQAVDSNTMKIKQTDWDALPTKNLIGAYAHTKSARWTLGTQTISAVNYTNRTVDLFGAPVIASGWGYFLNNKLEMLDSEGEWFFDDKKLTVYFWPPASVDLNMAVVEGAGYALDVPSTDGTSTIKDMILNGFNILNAESNATVSYVTVRNFHIIQHSGTGVNALADNLVIDNNFIEYVDGPGIFVSRNTMGQNAISIRNNRINYSNNLGIHLKAEDSEVINNSITNIGRFESLGKLGMSGTPPKNNQYVGNPNDDGVGIRFYGQNLSLKGNHLDYIAHNGFFFKAKNFRLEENIINHPCYTKADCGGIYTYFAMSYLPENANLNIILRRNIVLNSIGNTDGARRYNATETGSINYEIPFGMGVYIDGHGKGITLEENAAVNCSASGLIVQDSSDITLTGNVAINNKGVQLDIMLQDAPYMDNFNLKQNMLYALNKTQKTISVPSLTNNNDKNTSHLLKSSDENYLFNPYSRNTPSVFLDPAYYVIIRGGSNNYSLATWQQERGLDLHSMTNWFYLKPYTIANIIGTNLLKNPDFSSGISEWNNNFGVTAWDAKYSGGSMAVDRGTQTSGTIATYGETLNLVPGKQYRIQFSAATRDKIAALAVSIQRTGSGTTTERTLLRRAFTLGTQMQEFDEVFTVPDTTPVQLIFSTIKEEIDHYWLDNISLQEVVAYDLPVSDAYIIDINANLPFNFRTALFPQKAIFFYNSASTAKDFDLQNVSYRTLNNLPFGQDGKFAKYYSNGKLHLEAASSVILMVDSFAPLAASKLNLNSGATNGQLVGDTLFSLKTDGTLSYSVNNAPQTLALQNTGFGMPVGGFKGEVTGVLYLTQGHVRYPMGSLLVTTSSGKLYHWHPYLQTWQSSEIMPLKSLFSIPSAEGELLATLENNNVVLLDTGAKIPLSSIAYPSQETVKYITRDNAGIFYYVVTTSNQVYVFNALASVWSRQ